MPKNPLKVLLTVRAAPPEEGDGEMLLFTGFEAPWLFLKHHGKQVVPAILQSKNF